MFFVRTKIYSVYLKKENPNPLEGAVFVSQGFNFWAFLFNIGWALFNRLWLVSLLLFILNFFLMGLNIPAAALVTLLTNIWFGFEANSLRADKLEKKGYILFDVVTGIDVTAAEQRFFDKYLFNKTKLPGSSPQAA